MSTVSEVDSLRSQVAELARELAERDQALHDRSRHLNGELQDLREQSQRLHAIVTSTAQATGDDFFPTLVTQLTSVLGVQYAVIGEVRQNSGAKKIHTMAVAAGGALVNNFEYDLSYTPCETALASSFAWFEQGVQASFPSFTRLGQLNVESYCGVSIRTKSGEVIGLLVIMDVKPLRNRDWLRSLLTMFASRASAELDRARAEEERSQALADLHNVMETIPDILFTLDLQGRLVRWNPTLERVTGYSAMELLNKHALEFVPPAEHEPTASAIQRAFQHGYAELEGHLLTKDGRTIPYYWTGATLHNPQGHVVGLTGVGRDIADRKKEEEKRLLLYKAIFLHSIDGIAIVDPEGRYLTQNPAHEQMLGYSQDQLTGKTPAIHLGEETFSHIVEELVSTGQYRGEVASHTASGESLPLDLAAFAMYDETGSTTCYVGIKRDIRRRKEAEDALAHLNATLEQQVEARTTELRASEERLRLAMEIADLATWDWDIATNHVIWSENCERVKRLPPGTFDGTFEAYQRLVHPDDLPTLFADINRALAGPAPYHTEHRIVPPGGEIQWVEGNGIVYRTEDGQPIRMVGTVHNITERKRAEQLLEMENHVLALMASATPLPDTLNFLCQSCESLGHGMLASVLLLDEDSQQLRHYASPSLPDSYTRAIDGVAIGPGVGSCGTAAYLGQQVIVTDIATDPLWEGYSELALNHGLRACWSNPIISEDGRVMGTFAVYYRTPRKPIPADLQLIDRLANLVRLAIERTQGKHALRMSEEKLRQSLLASNTGLWDWNTETNEVRFSREWKKQLGYEEAELADTFETWESRLHPDDHDRAVAYAIQYRDNPVGVFRQDFRLRHKDGTYRWIDSHASFVTESDGRRVNLLGSHTDITERKQAEEGLQLFRALLDQVTDSIEVVDPSTGQFLDGNRQSHESIGYTRSELLDLTVPDIDPLVTQPVFQERMQQLREVAIPLRVESLHLRKDGTTFPVEVVAQILHREREYLVAVVRDITTRKQLEAVRARQYEALQAIFNMTVALSRAASLEEIYEQGINGVQAALKVDRASILLFDDDDVMRFKASRGLSKEYIQAVEGHSPWSRGAVNPPPIGMKDIEEDPSVEAFRGIFRAEHIRALGFIPLWSSDGLLGKFMLYYDCPHQFTEEEIQVAQTIAGHIAFMIQRKRAEEALRVSEERYARATAIGKVGVWQLDVASGQYHGDANLKALFGYGPTEVSTDPFAWLGLVHPDDQPIALKSWEQIVSGATDEYHYELRMIRKDGSIIWTQVRGHAVRSETGGIVQLIGATVDITERKRAEAVLRLTQFSVDRAVDAVFWVAPDARILNVNGAACRMLEYTSEELMAMTVHDIDPNFPAELWPAHWEELKQKGSMTFESKHWSRTGRVLETEVTVNYLQYEGLEYNCAIMRDISERKRAEEALAQNELAIRTLHEATAASGLSFDERIQKILEVGCRRFNLPIGMLTQVVGNNLELVQVWAPGTDFKVGMAVPLEKTYCNTTLQKTEPVCFAHAGTSDWQYHPGYKALGLESYIGTRLIGRDQIHGTICFAGQNPLPALFSQADKDFVQLMARWISGEMDRRQAERALKHSEERYRALYDDTPTMYFTLAVDGTVVSVNRYGADQLGYRVEELVGQSVLRIFHEADKEAVAASLSECLETPETTKYWEFRKVRRDGTVIWVQETTRVGQSSTGETVVLVTCEDITERKQAAEALRLSEEQFRAVFENAAVGIAVGSHTTGTDIDQVNPVFAAMLGYTPEELCRLGMKGITFPDDIPASREFVRQLIGGTRSHGAIEKRYVKKDGSLVWAQTTVSSILDKHGNYLKSITLIQDITERKRMEAELQRSHAFLRQVIDVDPNFIFAKDRDGRFTLVNNAVAEAYGTTVEDLIGKTDADFNPNQGEVEYFRRKDLEVMDTLYERFIPEEKITDSTGSIRWLQTVKRPILDAQGQAIMVLGAATDITERKQMEEALRQRERDLRTAVEERERISEDLHDGILQSIYAIGLGLEACMPLVSDLPNKSAAKLNVALRRTIGQLNNVLEDVRNFIAGLESQILNGQEFDLVLRTMVHTLASPYSIPCRVAIDQAAAQDLSTEQAYHVMNLAREAMSNSLRHSEATRIRVSLSQLSRSIRLSIIDNGLGFNPNAKRNRGHGLANMAARAQKLGGKFALQSKPHQGTKVLVDIPRRFVNADT